MPTLKSATARFAMRYPVTEEQDNRCESLYWQKISDDVNFSQEECPKIEPSESFKRPKYLQQSLKLLNTSKALSFRLDKA